MKNKASTSIGKSKEILINEKIIIIELFCYLCLLLHRIFICHILPVKQICVYKLKIQNQLEKNANIES